MGRTSSCVAWDGTKTAASTHRATAITLATVVAKTLAVPLTVVNPTTFAMTFYRLQKPASLAWSTTALTVNSGSTSWLILMSATADAS